MVIFNKDNPLSIMVDIFNENFCVDMQGKRANKAKKMIKELLENDIGEES